MIVENPAHPILIAKILGLRSTDNLALARQVEGGLSFAAFERLSKSTGLPMERLRATIRLTPRTMTRRRSEARLSPHESDRLVSISRLFALAFEMFEGDRDLARRWFTSPSRALGGRTPLQTAVSEVGSREVEDLIGRIEDGVFS